MEKPNRKKLGRGDAGTNTIFGQDRVDFENKSNTMAVLSVSKPKDKKWAPVRKEKTAE